MLQIRDIDADKDYSTIEVAEVLDLSYQHVVRLINDGQFPGTYRKAPVAKSPYRVPGSAVIDFMEKRKQL